ncbi:Uncharacterized conserved protein [Janthinobacterium sp. Marseille]|uniref:Copper-binding protein n=1 Tax=Herminiimonas contaminans TaxID=1111140 RepID=A0ABS0EXW9_9BURK|nr:MULTISPECIES: copper-binding protein [Oxalobacteraceae]ABR91571.1 Uncharacterized conserved protein [Janthinobacterium sp. Marseille]MBF8179677.1 copper-binding protein [Herminiimonas contaminans]
MKKSLLNLVAVFGFSFIAITAYAEQGSRGIDMSGMKKDKIPGNPMNTMSLSDGVVNAVEKENSHITLKHGRIKSATVEMGPMTMSFAVKDKGLLSDVKVGDKVKFTVENIDGTATVTVLSIQK